MGSSLLVVIFALAMVLSVFCVLAVVRERVNVLTNVLVNGSANGLLEVGVMGILVLVVGMGNGLFLTEFTKNGSTHFLILLQKIRLNLYILL